MGVDSSTQATKVSIHDAESGERVASGRCAHEPTGAAPRSEADPRHWWNAFEAAYRAAGAPKVAAVAVGGQQHGMVTLDFEGVPVRPAKLWNDTESAPDAEWCTRKLGGGPAAWAQATGSVPVAAFTVTKLSWLHRSEPENWARVARVCLPHDYLNFRLTGNFTTDRGDASGTGYFSPSTGEYRSEILSLIDNSRDWNATLPRVLGPLEPAGYWGGALVACGTGDNMAGALGVGLQAGDVVISIGTSGTVYCVSESPTADPTGAVAGFADATGRYLPLVCTLNATRVTDTFRSLLGATNEEFDDLASASPTDANGAVLLPYLDGERTPNRPNARGLLAGFGRDLSREALARAAINGVVCGLLDGFDALFNALSKVPTALSSQGRLGRLFVVGGGSQSRSYVQTLADLSGHSIHRPIGDEFVAIGAARQAASTLAGHWRDWDVEVASAVAPSIDLDERSAIRSAYAKLRDGAAGN